MRYTLVNEPGSDNASVEGIGVATESELPASMVADVGERTLER